MPTDDRPTRLSLPLDFNRDHVLGNVTAPLQLIEYGDYECPDCLQLYPIIDQLRERFGSQLLFVFRHFPLFTVHRHASVAAQAAEAAGSQGKFWEMHDQLYRNQNRLETPDLTHYALRLGLDVYRFEHDLGAGFYRKRVEADFKSGQASGVKGTPTLFINGERYQGPPTFEAVSDSLSRSTERGNKN